MQVTTPAAAMAIRDSLEEEVLIALVRAAWLAAERSNAVTADAGLSPSQYNVLRILRAAGREGLSCTEIATRPRAGPCCVASIATYPKPRNRPLGISVVLDSPRSATCWSPSHHPNPRSSRDTSLSLLRIAAAVRAP